MNDRKPQELCEVTEKGVFIPLPLIRKLGKTSNEQKFEFLNSELVDCLMFCLLLNLEGEMKGDII